jgi:two-component system chemotaxis response regulator CheY
LQEIKAIDSNAKVIMLSAVGQESKINEAKSAGAIEFITKTFKNDQIQSAIAKFPDNK